MPGARWTVKERRLLKRELKRTGDIDEVEVPGRTQFSIRQQARRMKLVAQRPGRFKWPAAQIEKLEELAGEGLSAGEIFRFELLGEPARSLWAIRKMWGRLKLADPRRSEQMKHRKVWKPGEKQRFDQFLRKNSARMTPEQIGTEWGVARSTVARRQTELGVKRPRSEVLEMEYSRAKRERARRRLRQRNLKYWQEKRQQREMDLIALAARYRRRGGVATQQCTDCERVWPKRPEFFHTSEKQISIGTSRYYKHRCVLCENERRRGQQQSRQKASSG